MNSKVKLKVCGMRDPENILQVAELQPDYMGFIFYPGSTRFVGNEFAIPAQLPTQIKRVGVFVNETMEKIQELSKNHCLNFIQLHGNESTQQCAELKKKGLGVIKVFSVDNQFSLEVVKPYQQTVDYFMFDTKSELYGGSGKTFNWNILKQYDQKIPFFLSGGLSISNIQQAKELLNINLHAVDVNSGIELSPGLKSVEKLKELNHFLIT